jgi:phospholipase C
VLGPTYPNRAVWMSGTNDPQGLHGGPILETVKPNTLTWTSAAEVLYDAGYTVKTYTSSGSYNYFSWWQSFTAKGKVDDALYNRVMLNGTLFGDGRGGIGDPLAPTTAQTSYLGFEEDCPVLQQMSREYLEKASKSAKWSKRSSYMDVLGSIFGR